MEKDIVSRILNIVKQHNYKTTPQLQSVTIVKWHRSDSSGIISSTNILNDPENFLICKEFQFSFLILVQVISDAQNISNYM
ncbi:MAG: hypothetical protein WBX81_06955 [Nitrososphaeraceae archaeon]